MMKRLLFTVTVVLLALGTVQAGRPQKPGNGGTAPYSIIPFLPPDLDTRGSQVEDLNEVGQAVGSADLVAGGEQALHLDVGSGVYTALTGGSAARGVNNLNQTVGYLQVTNATAALFWSTPAADPVSLPALPGDLNSWAFAINDAGIVVGSSDHRGVAWRVVVDANGEVHVSDPVTLPVPEGGSDWLALDLGEMASGVVVVAGRVWIDSLMQATVWQIGLDPEDGTIVVTAPAVALGNPGQESWSYATNAIGDVCGETGGLPFIAPAGQDIQPLPLPRNTQWGRAMGVNNSGGIVGELDIYRVGRGFIDGPGNFHAYLWSGGQTIDLETVVDLSGSGWTRLSAANVINDAGVIAGWGSLDVDLRGFLLILNDN